MSEDRLILDPKIPPGKELLEDVFLLDFNPDDLHEGVGGKPKLKGRLGFVETPTANKRRYKKAIMEREISRLKPHMESRAVYGELDHPSDGKTLFSRTSHFVLDATINEKNEIIGEIEFIPGTKNGDQAIAIARAGGKLGVSSRGVGSVAQTKDGFLDVQEDYQLFTWDVVVDPANSGAYPKFVYEDKEDNLGITIDDFKRDNPEAYDALIAEAKKANEVEARDHAREALREDFEKRLLEESDKLKKEATERAKADLLKDPEVAGASTAIDRIKEIVAPFILDEDENRELANIRKSLSDANRKVASQDEEIKRLNEENQELVRYAKEFGFQLHLERMLSDDEHKGEIIEMVGDVCNYENVEDLRSRVEAISESLSEGDKIKSQYEQKILDLEANARKLEEERDRALLVGKKFGVRAYAEKAISGHPQRSKLRAFLSEHNPDSVESVDALVEAFTEASPLSDEYRKIRSGVGNMRSVAERRYDSDELRSKDVSGDLKEDHYIGGVPMRELVSL